MRPLLPLRAPAAIRGLRGDPLDDRGQDASHRLRECGHLAPVELALPVSVGVVRFQVIISHEAPQGDFARGPIGVVAE